MIPLTEQELDKLVDEKFTEELKKFDRPHKFFVTQNGRGIVDGGDLYNKVFEDVLQVVQNAVKDVLKETVLKK